MLFFKRGYHNLGVITHTQQLTLQEIFLHDVLRLVTRDLGAITLASVDYVLCPSQAVPTLPFRLESSTAYRTEVNTSERREIPPMNMTYII
jgi:hypothetical protein